MEVPILFSRQPYIYLHMAGQGEADGVLLAFVLETPHREAQGPLQQLGAFESPVGEKRFNRPFVLEFLLWMSFMECQVLLCFFFFFTLVKGPGRSLSLMLSDTPVYEPTG